MAERYTDEIPYMKSQINKSAVIAFRIAAAYPRTIPSADALREKFGMSTATAYRFIKSLKVARGIDQ